VFRYFAKPAEQAVQLPATLTPILRSGAYNWVQRGGLLQQGILDRICSFEAGKQLTAVKNVSLAEEYLADHFPEFPVLPGVFMLEAATQAGAWLVRLSENYAHSIVVLHEARAVKYADFVTPGHRDL